MGIVTGKGDGAITLEVKGRVNTVISPTLQETILNASMKTGGLVLNFAQVKYISSASLHVLLIGEKTVKGKGGSMELIRMAASVMNVFEVTGFSGILHIE